MLTDVFHIRATVISHTVVYVHSLLLSAQSVGTWSLYVLYYCDHNCIFSGLNFIAILVNTAMLMLIGA